MLLRHVRPACAAALAASMALLVRPAAADLHHVAAVAPGVPGGAAHHARPHLSPRPTPRAAAAAAPPAAPVLDVAVANTGGNGDRSMCLTISAGAGAAYECGDLRLAHALPVTRTMNRARGPVLLYSSQQAQPYPVVAANVRLPQGAAVPASVTARCSSTTHSRPPPRGRGRSGRRGARAASASASTRRRCPRPSTPLGWRSRSGTAATRRRRAPRRTW